jgi:hypothetical protein
VDVEIHIFFISAIVGGEWSASYPSRFTPGEGAPDNHLRGGWLAPRSGLDERESRIILTGLEI